MRSNAILLLFLTPLLSTSASAHVSEQGFVLLLPTKAYIAGGVAAVALSIIFLAFLTAERSDRLYQPLMTVRALQRSYSPSCWQVMTSLISFCFLVWLLYLGFAGSRDPLSNPLPLFIWTLWWIGFVVLQGVVGDCWRWVNPWTGLYSLVTGRTVDMLFESVVTGESDKLLKSGESGESGESGALDARQSQTVVRFLTLPSWLDIWPGVLLFVAFMTFALADIAPDDPARLAGLVGGYYLLCFAGMLVFGAEVWLFRCECFSIVFRYYAMLAPISFREGRIYVGVPGWRAYRWLQRQLGKSSGRFQPSVSTAVFVLVLLACGSFDGLNETFWWLAIIDVNPLEFPGRSAVMTETISGLLFANVALIAVFAGSTWVGLWLSRRAKSRETMIASQSASASVAFAGSIGSVCSPEISFKRAFCSLAIGILPIAFAYHFAHFFTAFLVNSQYALAAASDPFHNGADLLGLGTYYVTTGFFNTHHTMHVIWLIQAGTVVLGHMLSVLLTHAIAMDLFGAGKRAVVSQIPLALFMILYTFLGLWLLASPRGA